jgi:hypothetical protein
MGVTGCAGGLPVTTASTPAPVNYAKLTADYFAVTVPKQTLAGAAISAIRPAVAPQPAEWIACVRLASGEYYAAFYAEGNVVDARSALTIDRCGVAEGYAPFPLPEKPKPAAKPAKGKKEAKD